jgi:hypothetical protein
MKRVDVLVVEGCPHTEAVIERARTAIDRAAVDAELHVVVVDGDDRAEALRFLGSPTVRVDGIDVERPGCDPQFGLACRLYSVGGRLEPMPPIAWIVGALRGEWA